MTRTRLVDNRKRPAQPEPNEDAAVTAPPVREQGTMPTPRSDEEKRVAEGRVARESPRPRRRP